MLSCRRRTPTGNWLAVEIVQHTAMTRHVFVIVLLRYIFSVFGSPRPSDSQKDAENAANDR